MKTVHQKGAMASLIRGILGALFGAFFGLMVYYPSWRFRGMFDDGEFAVWVAIGATSLVMGLGAALCEVE